MKKPTYERSRLEILHYILQFSTFHYFGDKKEGYDNIQTDLQNCFRGYGEVEKGSLCVLSACSTTKWYMSWCLDIKEGGDFGSKQYLMKSIEDGELIWWHNVSVWQYPKEKTDQMPHWKWSDDKYQFWEKWRKVFIKRDAFGLVSMMPKFSEEDNSVTLRMRRKFSDESIEKNYDSYKKLTQKQMLEFYDEFDKNSTSLL